jgi:hypothetical protein
MTDPTNVTDIKVLEDDSSSFFRIGAAELTKLLGLVAVKQLQHRDITILLAFVSLTDWRSGRCRATCAAIGKMVGRTTGHVVLSLKRLKDCELILPFTDWKTGDKYLIVNPNFLVCGSGKRRGFLIKCFNETLQEKREAEKERMTNCIQLPARKTFIDTPGEGI